MIGIGWKVRLAFLPTLGQKDIWIEVSESCQRLRLIGGSDTRLHAIHQTNVLHSPRDFIRFPDASAT